MIPHHSRAAAPSTPPTKRNFSHASHPLLSRRSLGGAAPTRRACAVAASLGFALDDSLTLPHESLDPASITIPPGSITLLLGPSGAGKSTLLHALAHHHASRGITIIRPATNLPDRPAVDLFPSLSIDAALAALSRAGLAEAGCFVRRPSELSDGQRDRLRLALALQHATSAPSHHTPHSNPDSPAALLILDEFAALLDLHSARAVAFLLRRCIDHASHPIAALIATPRHDLTPWLSPDTAITLSPSARALIRTNSRATASDPLADITIAPGARDDYLALAPLHYRASHPATIVRILAARLHQHPDPPILAGVLLLSMPVLNARWRNLAWPDRYSSPDKRGAARLLNNELRCISRVIIDPRFRALGLAQRLVRAYLHNPLTPNTEALAAMGRASPFFHRAGMTPYPLTPAPRDARLLDALQHLGLEPWRLATPATALRRATSTTRDARFLEAELRRWAAASHATLARRHAPITALFRSACRSIACPQTAYAWTTPH